MNSGLKVPLFLRPARRFALAGGEGFSRRDGKGEFFETFINIFLCKIQKTGLKNLLNLTYNVVKLETYRI